MSIKLREIRGGKMIKEGSRTHCARILYNFRRRGSVSTQHLLFYTIFSAFDILNFYNIYIILRHIHIGNYVKSLGLLLHFVDTWVRVRVRACARKTH